MLIFLDVKHQGHAIKMQRLQETADPAVVFLFDGDTLVDASDGARALLTVCTGDASPWDKLLSFVTPRFPDFEHSINRLPAIGRIALMSRDSPPLTLRAERTGGVTRITLLDAHAASQGAGLDPVAQRALEDEVAQLRETLDSGPFLVWCELDDGSVIWASRPYLDKAAELRGGQEAGVWPFPRLFRDLDLVDAMDGAPKRAALDRPGGSGCDWYDCRVRPSKSGRVVYAIPANDVVRAETSLSGFMQTLTKTFAQLSVGLAVFGNDRRLALFNPALIELTTLDAEFLSSRPTLTRFLDALRDRQMIPEPKDYKAWRMQLSALEQAAAAGQYQETWALTSQRTYRVTARPHDDGGVAFLFEDITHEIDRTRRFRAELEIGQAVIDAMEEAIAVFAASGQMVLSNDAYRKLWQADEDLSPTASGIAQAVALWQSNCAPSPLWERADPFFAALGARKTWSVDARLRDGRALLCRFVPLAGGATMVTFNQSGADIGAEGMAAAKIKIATGQ